MTQGVDKLEIIQSCLEEVVKYIWSLLSEVLTYILERLLDK